MKKILAATSNSEILQTVKNTCIKYSSYFEANIFSDTEQVINYIDYELPEIKVLDFGSKDVDAKRVLSEINGDPWLHYGGIIAVCENARQVEEIEALKNVNIIMAMTVGSFTRNFSRLVRILYQNQQFLLNRGMQDTIGGQEIGSFICSNDPVDIRFYTNFLVGYLYNTNRITEDERLSLQMTLMELLTNALEHGNLEISYEEKSNWLDHGGDILDLIANKAAQAEFKNRKIHISYKIGKSKSQFSIRDDGLGFDWKKQMKAKADDGELHGRGINLSLEMVQNLTYNEVGNEVSFEINNQLNKTNSVPSIMNSFDVIDYEDKQLVCRENEASNDLFFIVSGRFAVYADRKLVSVLTPNDMFIGEMAFLLNDRRSATVLAVGKCTLIKISKGAFLALIRRNPHYGIFLSKMLALRLQKQTQKTIELSSKK
ncbi:MAG: cyclic nucleotide-binding domain-containing protein [Treponema sp.]|nr:cyclic nucleotide-binding domain-containing protein [Candidatus Treponema equifaecale]